MAIVTINCLRSLFPQTGYFPHSSNPAGVETPASKRKSSQRGLMSFSVFFERTFPIRQGIDSLADSRVGQKARWTHSNPAGVETPASKRKSSQRGLMSFSVLFERTLAIRQGIDSLADSRVGQKARWTDSLSCHALVTAVS